VNKIDMERCKLAI